jgi:hypothetical protein
VAARFETNDVDAEVRAVLAGIGIGQVPSYLAGPLVAQGRLVHLLVKHTSERMGLYLCFAQRAHPPRRERLFIDVAVAHLHAHPDAVRRRDARHRPLRGSPPHDPRNACGQLDAVHAYSMRRARNIAAP